MGVSHKLVVAWGFTVPAPSEPDLRDRVETLIRALATHHGLAVVLYGDMTAETPAMGWFVHVPHEVTNVRSSDQWFSGARILPATHDWHTQSSTLRCQSDMRAAGHNPSLSLGWHVVGLIF